MHVFQILPTLLSLSLAIATLAATRSCADEPQEKDARWKHLFDGKSLDGWKITKFGGEGEVVVEDGELLLDFGSSLTGVTYMGELPKTNYEICLEARRIEGVDFFCTLTFPVADSFCSFVVGGWGGALVGLSSIDGADASENETTSYMRFDKDRWYRMRVRVRPDRIGAWIDEKQVVDQDIRDRQIDTRIEVELSKPLGIASWETRSAIRRVRLRKLDD